eukprot:577890-Alexandrium_andersonii.AAC.1
MVHCTCGRFKAKVRAPWDAFGKEDLRGRKWGVPDVVYQRWETVALFVGGHGPVVNGRKRLDTVGNDRTSGNGRK